MEFKKVSIFIFPLICFTIFAPVNIAAGNKRQNLPPGVGLKAFKELLASISAEFNFPDGYNEVKPLPNEKFSYQYAFRTPGGDFEVRIQVNSLKSEWRNYEQVKGDKPNPDSLYSKQALSQAKNMAGEGRYTIRSIPPDYLQPYNADLGRSYYISLADSPETNHYQFALMVVLQKNHIGDITVACMGNQRGPEFFKNITKLRDCIKFVN